VTFLFYLEVVRFGSHEPEVARLKPAGPKTSPGGHSITHTLFHLPAPRASAAFYDGVPPSSPSGAEDTAPLAVPDQHRAAAVGPAAGRRRDADGVAVAEAPGVGEGDGFQVYGVEFGEGLTSVVGAEGDQAGHVAAIISAAYTASLEVALG
jgi:hypothetical protein